MADIATTNGSAPVGKKEKVELVKPEKPDEEAHKAELKKLEKAHADTLAKMNAVKGKIDLAKPASKDSPSSKRRAELLAQIKEIREKQGAGKAGRNKVFDEIKAEDAKLKELIAQQKVARSRVSFKSVEDVDREIARLEKDVNGGMMKLADEKQALGDISNLRRQRKGFSGFEDTQKRIDDGKAKLKALRDLLEDPESKALSEKYNTLQAEMDAIKAEQDEAFKNLNALRDEKTRLQNEQNEQWAAIRECKDKYYQAGRAVQKWDYELRQRIRERKKAENEKYQQDKKKERAQQMLAEASDKAYLDEIRKAESLLVFLDPSYVSEKAPLQAPSKFQASAQRTVDDAGIKGVKVVRKEEEDYFAGTGGKKGKKAKNANKKPEAESTSRPKDWNCPPSVLETCSELDIEPPYSAADVPACKAKVEEKLAFWKKDQAAQTERNIAKAKKEVERLEAEEAAAGPAPETPTTANGESKETSQTAVTEDATEIAADLKEDAEDKEE